jgi:hypothetical protein
VKFDAGIQVNPHAFLPGWLQPRKDRGLAGFDPQARRPRTGRRPRLSNAPVSRCVDTCQIEAAQRALCGAKFSRVTVTHLVGSLFAERGVMTKIGMTILGLAAVVGCKSHSKAPLGDKTAACKNIYDSYHSQQDAKTWTDACMAAPDENVRCMNLVMKEGDDSDCTKLVKSPERTKLVTVLNGKPEQPGAAATPAAATPAATTPAAATAASGCGAGLVGGGDIPFCIRLPDGYKADGVPSKPDSWTSLDFKADGHVDISTEWTDGPRGYDNLVEISKNESSSEGHKLIASGATAGGGGMFVQYESSSGGTVQINFEAIYKSAKKLIKCRTSWYSDKPESQAAADACKSLTPQ